MADLSWLYFFLRPLLTLTIISITFAMIRTGIPLLSYGALVSMISLITPSQASYHQILFAPAVLGLVTVVNDTRGRFLAVLLFALMCSNYMGAFAHFDSGPAMVLAFPRVFIVLGLWIWFLSLLRDPLANGGPPGTLSLWERVARQRRVREAGSMIMAGILLISLASCFFSVRRWQLDEADGATMVDPAQRGLMEVQPVVLSRGVRVSTLTAEGFVPAPDFTRGMRDPVFSPDGRHVAVATDASGNWDIAIYSRASRVWRTITTSRANDLMPAFSLVGREIYFVSDRRRGYRFTALYKIRL